MTKFYPMYAPISHLVCVNAQISHQKLLQGAYFSLNLRERTKNFSPFPLNSHYFLIRARNSHYMRGRIMDVTHQNNKFLKLEHLLSFKIQNPYRNYQIIMLTLTLDQDEFSIGRFQNQQRHPLQCERFCSLVRAQLRAFLSHILRSDLSRIQVGF